MARGDMTTQEKIKQAAQAGASREDVLKSLGVSSFDKAQSVRWEEATDMEGNPSRLPAGTVPFTPEEAAEMEALFTKTPPPAPVIEQPEVKVPEENPKQKPVTVVAKEIGARIHVVDGSVPKTKFRAKFGRMTMSTEDIEQADKEWRERNKREHKPSMYGAYEDDQARLTSLATGEPATYKEVYEELQRSPISGTQAQWTSVYARLHEDSAKQAFLNALRNAPDEDTRQMVIGKVKDYLEKKSSNPLVPAAINQIASHTDYSGANGPSQKRLYLQGYRESLVKGQEEERKKQEFVEWARGVSAISVNASDPVYAGYDTTEGKLNAILLGAGETFSFWDSVFGWQAGAAMDAGPENFLELGLGEINQKLREQLVSLKTYEERREWVDTFNNFVNDPSNPLHNDLKAMYISEAVLTDEALRGEDATNSLDRVVGNIISTTDVAIGIMYAVRMPQIGAAVSLVRRSLVGAYSSAKAAATARSVPQFSREVFRALDMLSGDVRDAAVIDNLLPMSRTDSKAALLNGERTDIWTREPIPDSLFETQAKLDAEGAHAAEQAKRSDIGIYSPADKQRAVDNIPKFINQMTNPGAVRTNLTTMEALEDGSGVRFEAVIGSNREDAFYELTQAAEAAARIDPSFERVSVVHIGNDGKIIERVGPEEARELSEAGFDSGRLGEWYVVLKDEQYYHPSNALLFGENPVLQPGMRRRWFGTPRSQFSPEVYETYVSKFLTERGFVPQLQRILREGFTNASSKDRRTALQMLEFAETEGKATGKELTYWDIVDRFDGQATEGAVRAYQSMKKTLDTIYEISNNRLYRDMKSRGHRTATSNASPGVHYDGIPLDYRTVRGLPDKAALDPVSRSAQALSKGFLKQLYERGGRVIRQDLKVKSATGEESFDLIIIDPEKGWNLGNLRTRPLEYIPGYYPRIYKDHFFIKRSVTKMINGVPTKTIETLMTSPTRKDARKLVDRANNHPDVQTSGAKWFIEDDTAMAAKDRVAGDVERMQVEGRIIFDDRNEEALKNIHGDNASTLDPAEAVQRAIWATARLVSHDNMLRVMKTRFKNQYKQVLDAAGITGRFDMMNSSEIQASIKAIMASSKDEALRNLANEALPLWDYVRLTEGITSGDPGIFRRQAFRIADFVDTMLPSGKGGRLSARAAQELARMPNPVEAIKRLAFFDFIVSRPIRQLVLQGSQHMFIAPLDPLYFASGKWWMDTVLLMQGVKKFGSYGITEFADMTKAMRARNAKLMGISEAEYTTLVQKMQESGILQGIDAHIFGGGVKNERVFRVPKTKIGQVAEAGMNTSQKGYDLLKKGFDTGEGFNVSAAYMMALRRYGKDKGKTIAQFSDEDWNNILVKGSDYALAMHRANSSKYQYGMISLATQFLSFTHKTFLTMTFQNKAFSHAEAARILAGQYILFGASSFGIRDQVQGLLAETGIDIPEPLMDQISGGLMELIVDRAISKALGSDTNYHLGDFLAPGGNVIFTAQQFAEIAFQKPMAESLFGASAHTLGRLGEAWRVANLAFHSDKSPTEKVTIASEAIVKGFMSGFSDMTKANVALKYDQWYSGLKDPLGVKASTSEAFIKAILGINPEDLMDYYNITRKVGDQQRALKDDAKEAYALLRTMLVEHEDGLEPLGNLAEKLEWFGVILSMVDEEDRLAIHDEIVRLDKMESDKENKGIALLIAEAVTRSGLQPNAELIELIKRTPAISEEERGALLDIITRALEEYPDELARAEDYLKQETEAAKGDK